MYYFSPTIQMNTLETFACFALSCRETGQIIDVCDTYAEASQLLSKFESSDSKEGIYVENFYEIVELEGILNLKNK